MSIETLGILGGGQLAMLMASIVKNKGLKLVIYAQSVDEPAVAYADAVIIGAKDDLEKIKYFFQKSDCVLLESEFYAPELLLSLQEKTQTPVYPELSSYKNLYSKLNQKAFFKDNNIPHVRFQKIAKASDTSFIEGEGPYMAKISHGGYDGYGNLVIESKNEIDEKLKKFTSNFENEVLVEDFVTIQSEFACMLIKGKNNHLILPPCRTVQENSICTLVEYPLKLEHSLNEKLTSIMNKLAESLTGPGIYAFEFFETSDGDVLVNEAAPRVHNSYHFSIEAFDQSQFELFIEAALGMKLEMPKEKYLNVTMVNVLGQSSGPDYQLKFPEHSGNYDYKIHLYGKKECRPGRKMGHITLFGNENNRKYAEQIKSEYKI